MHESTGATNRSGVRAFGIHAIWVLVCARMHRAVSSAMWSSSPVRGHGGGAHEASEYAGAAASDTAHRARADKRQRRNLSVGPPVGGPPLEIINVLADTASHGLNTRQGKCEGD